MNKTKILIIILIILMIVAISFGIFMAYKTYETPMQVENLEQAVKILTSKVENENDRMIKLAMYNELSKSFTMVDRHTNEKRKFSNEEMQEIYSNIGGKEAVLNYLQNIKDDGKRRNQIQLAFDLKIIDKTDFNNLW